jgi:hypothetical protein
LDEFLTMGVQKEMRNTGADQGTMIDDSLPMAFGTDHGRVPTLDRLADIPQRRDLPLETEERPHRRAYRIDVQHFMRTLAITTLEELR